LILSKLEWYRLGGEVSERQSNDVLGVLRVQDDKVDRAYLQHGALELGLQELLNCALSDSEVA